MTSQPTERSLNHVRIVGTLDTQTISRREAATRPDVVASSPGERPRATLVQRINDVQGTEQRAVLQVPSPFGKPFQITLHLEGNVAGSELLTDAAPGTLLAAEGELEWVQTTDPRYALDLTERGRRASELHFRARSLALATPDDEPGCDVWLTGTVLTTTRILRHPDRPVRIAVTTVRVVVERTRRHSRARLSEPANVAIAIPLDHPDAPNLMRAGNEVCIEGMLERYLVPLRGVEVDRAVAALDASWTDEQAAARSPQALRDAERRYARQRRRLQETTRTRVIAGYVALTAGSPASVAEAQALRSAQQRARQEDRRARQRPRRIVAAQAGPEDPTDDVIAAPTDQAAQDGTPAASTLADQAAQDTLTTTPSHGSAEARLADTPAPTEEATQATFTDADAPNEEVTGAVTSAVTSVSIP
ncbi:MAG: hypothetical protein EOM24_06190, partial [Chloroflexia bacterium]|nr:hypothetical protein [Chloroflexia bacterium]